MKRRTFNLALLILSAVLVLSACGAASPVSEVFQEINSGLDDSGVQPDVASQRGRQSALLAEEPAVGALPDQPVGPGGISIPNGEPYDTTYYENYGTNPFIDTEDDTLSTFAMDVDTASYTVMRRYLEDGNLPDLDSVRVEEFINYFNYEYPEPEDGDFAIYMEAGPSPFGGERYEMFQIGIQGRVIDIADRKPASLTFVIDVSGSMARENRLGTVKQALALLVDEMRADDSIAIAVYGSDARAVLSPTSGQEKDQILRAINQLHSEGSTNVEAGLDVGFALADEAYAEDRINMVLLCSDGVANNGVTGAESLLQLYEHYIDQGIQLSTFGFGMENFRTVLT